jgi:hypothetical protein
MRTREEAAKFYWDKADEEVNTSDRFHPPHIARAITNYLLLILDNLAENTNIPDFSAIREIAIAINFENNENVAPLDWIITFLQYDPRIQDNIDALVSLSTNLVIFILKASCKGDACNLLATVLKNFILVTELHLNIGNINYPDLNFNLAENSLSDASDLTTHYDELNNDFNLAENSLSDTSDTTIAFGELGNYFDTPHD